MRALHDERVGLHLAGAHVLDLHARDSQEEEVRIVDAGPVLGEERDLVADARSNGIVLLGFRDAGDADVSFAALLFERKTELDVRVAADLSGLGAAKTGRDPELLLDVEQRYGADPWLIRFCGCEVDALHRTEQAPDFLADLGDGLGHPSSSG